MRRLQTKLKYQKVELQIYKTTHLSKNIKNYCNKHLILRRGLFAKAAFANMQIFIVFVKKGGAMPQNSWGVIALLKLTYSLLVRALTQHFLNSQIQNSNSFLYFSLILSTSTKEKQQKRKKQKGRKEGKKEREKKKRKKNEKSNKIEKMKNSPCCKWCDH